MANSPADFRFDLDEALALTPTPNSTTTTTIKTTPSSSSEVNHNTNNKAKKPAKALSEMATVRVGGDSVCCVCMEGFVQPHIDGPDGDDDEGGNGKRLACGHVYHPECILSWISSCNNSCPLCRHVL